MEQTTNKPLFPLGQVVTTQGVLAVLQEAGQSPPVFVARHATGDWGDLCKRDREENQFGLERRRPLYLSYQTDAGDEFWIITDRQFSTTTILLPE
jgi:hypothetical protein